MANMRIRRRVKHHTQLKTLYVKSKKCQPKKVDAPYVSELLAAWKKNNQRIKELKEESEWKDRILNTMALDIIVLTGINHRVTMKKEVAKIILRMQSHISSL